jgi:acyl carrier protein
MTQMTHDEIYEMIVDGLHTTFQLDRAKITIDANLYSDLDIDSIDAVDLAVKLQQATGKRITPDVFKTVRTVRDLVNAVDVLLQSDGTQVERSVAPTRT